MRKCGFTDCNSQIKWQETECKKCFGREENFKCDACLRDKGYNLLALGGALRDFINDTEIMLQRTQKMFVKVPSQFHDLLREMKQSLVLTEEEKQAIAKKKRFWVDFIRRKNCKRRDNFHLIKLCRECLDELAKEEEKFTENNPDVKKIAEKWTENQKNHLRILEEIDRGLGRNTYEKIQKELEQEVKEKFPQEDEPPKESKEKSRGNKNGEISSLLLIFLAASVLLVIALIIRKRKK